MSDDLVKRLRFFAQGLRRTMWASRDESSELMDKAADRIEALEAKLAMAVEALHKIAKRDEEMIWGEYSEVRDAFNDMRSTAFAALAAIKGEAE